MTRTIRILSLAHSLANAHGDAENADVLVRRLRWRGLDAELVRVDAVSGWPAEGPDAIVIGGPTDPELPRAAALLRELESTGRLSSALEAGVPTLAVAGGWELLGGGAELADGSRVAGLGLAPGRGVPRGSRAADDLIVDGPFGRLVGFENHDRDLLVEGEGTGEDLGSVAFGVGRGDGREGLVLGPLTATRMHGPALARNPILADRMLAAVLERMPEAMALPEADERTARVDGYARETRQRTLRERGLEVTA